MIRLWIAAHSSASIRKQLDAQLLLGILSGRLAPGERLPSIRALARRLRIHPNTVALVYQDLSARGWLQTRPGSGVFVAVPRRKGDTLAEFVSEWLDAAERRGFTPEALQRELSRRTSAATASTRDLLVVDPDPELARIIAAELGSALHRPVGWTSVHDAAAAIGSHSRVFVIAGHAAEIAPLLDPHPLEPVRLNSMQDLLAGKTRPGQPMLIAVVSRSATVRNWAATLLSALGFSAEEVLLRDPADDGWQEGLSACHILGADVCAAAELPPKLAPAVFRVVSDDSLVALAASA